MCLTAWAFRCFGTFSMVNQKKKNFSKLKTVCSNIHVRTMEVFHGANNEWVERFLPLLTCRESLTMKRQKPSGPNIKEKWCSDTFGFRLKCLEIWISLYCFLAPFALMDLRKHVLWFYFNSLIVSSYHLAQYLIFYSMSFLEVWCFHSAGFTLYFQ